MLPLSRFALPVVLSVALALIPAGKARADLTSFEQFVLFSTGVVFLGMALSSQGPAHASPPPHHGAIRVMPAHCIRQGQSAHRPVHVLPQHCLARAGVHVTSLPDQCRVHIRGIGPGYTARCLRAKGFVIG